MSNHVVYQILCKENDKSYVGITCNWKIRKSQHFCDLKGNRHHNYLLQEDYNKYGHKAFIWHIIERNIPNESIACEAEIYWIQRLDSLSNGYNLTIGGNRGVGFACVWNGVNYSSILEAAIANNISPTAMHNRINKGYTCDDEVGREVKCVWNGVTYDSITKMARAIGITKRAAHKRVQKGYTCDGDVNTDLNGTSCTWNETHYSSIKEAALANDVSANTMQARLANGYTCDGDVKPFKLECVWNGITYHSLSEAARQIGISRKGLSFRLNKGYTCDDDMKQRRK